MKCPLVPSSQVRYFRENQHCADALPGDLILVRHSGILPTIIRTGQRIKYFVRRTAFRQNKFEAAFCTVNHAMIVTEGGPDAKVSQMEARGGTIVSLRDYVSKSYAVIRLDNVSDEQRFAGVRFANWCEGIKYSWLSILGCTINVFVPHIEIALDNGERMICSTAASLALRCMGLVPDRNDANVMPADLARYFEVRL